MNASDSHVPSRAVCVLPQGLAYKPKVLDQVRIAKNPPGHRIVLLVPTLILCSHLVLYAQAKEPRELFPVCKNGKCGYIHRTGRIAIPLQFDQAYDFSGGLARINSFGSLLINSSDSNCPTSGAVLVPNYIRLQSIWDKLEACPTSELFADISG